MKLAHLIFMLVFVSGAPVFAQDEQPDEVSADEVSPEVEAAESSDAVDVEPPSDAPAKRTVTSASRELLLTENEGRGRTNRIGALALGGWALGNFGWATVGLVRDIEDRERAFHLTNAAVNLIVAGVAVGTYFANVPDEGWENLGVVETLDESHGTEKLYLLAAGLDVAYIMTGAFLTAKGNLDRKEGMVGTGRSLMLQGSVLLAFDAAMFTLHMLRRAKFTRQLLGRDE